MNIVYGVCSWGLGHATRSLPVIRALLREGHALTVISHDRALALLRQELGSQVRYEDIPDYPMLLSENARQFLAKSIIYWPVFIQRIEAGLERLQGVLAQQPYHIIVSDGRYDMYSRKLPSFFISHQIRIMNPLRIKILERGSERFNQFFFNRFTAVLVPDYATDSLSGDLSHDLRLIDEGSLQYVGVLSDFCKKAVPKDIDYLISLSGPEPQRSILEAKVLAQANDLKGTVVVTKGKTESYAKEENGNITTYSAVTREQREDLLNRAKMLVTRSGYTTIMDLAVTGTKALVIPTPGQIEQEYLASYHQGLGTFHATSQEGLDLSTQVQEALKKTGIQRECCVDRTVENILRVIAEKTPVPELV